MTVTTGAPVLGNTLPRIYTKPLVTGPPGPCTCGCALTPDSSRGFEVAEFAKDVLGIELLPWQRWFLIHALERTPLGRYRFPTILLLVARQNGKSFVMTVLALHKMWLDGAKMVIGTAQNLDLSEKAWAEAVDLVETIPELQADVTDVVRVNGKKALVTRDSQYKVAAASRRGGRGFSGDFILLDELREHQHWEAWSAVTKDLANDTPILRGDGSWARIGDMAVGDRVFAPSGKAVTVTKVQPIQELRPMYRVTTTDGRSVVASASHLWAVKDMRSNYDLNANWETLSTEEILRRGLTYKASALRFRLPHQDALLDLPEADLPIPPYVLGAWLGDGTSADGTLTVGGQDLSETTRLLEEQGATVTASYETRPGTYRVRLHVAGTPMRSTLRSLNLLGNKHVPMQYETASYDQRLALLRGLMDTDGCAPRPGYASFSNTNEALADSVLFLARSLGFTARKREVRAKLSGKDCGPYWLVYFNVLNGDPSPFLLERKSAKATDSSKKRDRLFTSIASIEPVESVPSTCIAVDSDDHLFLAGRDLIPTHNTTTARPDSQILGLSNAGDESSVVLAHLRKQALAKVDDPTADIGIFEWSAEDGCSLDDVTGWQAANPALGYTITVEKIRSFLSTDPESVFRTETLCQWVGSMSDPVIPLTSWRSCLDDSETPEPVTNVHVALDVSPQRDRAAVSIAGRRSDGFAHIEVVAAGDGVDWAAETAARVATAYGKDTVVLDPGSAAGSLMTALHLLGIKVESVGVTDIKQGCGMIYDAVVAGDVRHIGQIPLDNALAGAKKRDLMDAWAWARRASNIDITPLTSVTFAHWALLTYEAGNEDYDVLDSLDLSALTPQDIREIAEEALAAGDLKFVEALKARGLLPANYP